jgi:transcriptional regulator with XRE-family HTH domain
VPQATPKRAGKQAKAGSRFPAEVLARNVRDYRKLRNLSQEELGERMAALGHGWTAGIVGFVERADRNMTVDELLGAALVLGVAPGHLLSPYGVDGHDPAALDVGLAEPISFGAAFAWVDQAVVAELDWSDGPGGIYWRPNQRTAAVEEGDRQALADTLNVTHSQRKPAKRNPRRAK